MPPSARHLLFACIGVLFVGACSGDSSQRILDRYLDRLARPLEQDLPTIAEPGTPIPPRSGATRIELSGGSLDTLDFLDLTGCAVQVTIGKRNSSLGRMATDSQRLLLELEYLQLAPECIAHLRRDKPQLADTLKAAWRLKREQLPARIFNATLGGGEYRRLWRRPASLGDYPRNTSSVPLSALAAVNHDVRRWLAGDYSFDNREFEIRLSEVASGDGGPLLRALALQHGRLAAADAVVARRLQQGPLCTPGMRPAAADILTNVIHKYFLGEVQPWSASIGRRAHQLLPPVRELEQLLEAVLPPPYRSWRRARDDSLQAWSGAPRRHVRLLQELQGPCQLR